MQIEPFLNGQPGLELSPEKTYVATFRKGFSFLGFDISSRSIRMRGRSVKKFKDRIRKITRRSRNMDDAVITRINRAVRGTANYSASPFSHTRMTFGKLDQWIQMRLRCMILLGAASGTSGLYLAAFKFIHGKDTVSGFLWLPFLLWSASIICLILVLVPPKIKTGEQDPSS